MEEQVILDQLPVSRVNARKTDAFDIHNSRLCEGSNPYLDTAAFVFDFALTGNSDPLPIEAYVDAVGDRYPHLSDRTYESYAHLFAQVAAEVNQLDIGLHLHQWSVTQRGARCCLAVEALHGRTTRSVIYAVWDWFEAITQGQRFYIEDQIEMFQQVFRQSVYGGPTVYALLRTAHEKGIPTFYLWDEGLMQYGYGKKLVRGVATTFDTDSHLDSDFTTRKDDCKAFLSTLGFPVPSGEIVVTRSEALAAADRIGYPIAVKPVSGHKGEGVTADVGDSEELEAAFDRAVEAIPGDQPVEVIVETSIAGSDFRILCVNGRFVAAMERKPASVTGDGQSTISELIRDANRAAARSDTPTSPLGKIKADNAMEVYLDQQGFTLESILEEDRTVYLRKVANLSAGGVSIDATPTIHPDNVILAQDIAQHFRLTCLGIDAITRDLSRSWKDGNFGILEINSAPGISMHLNPSVGDRVDVTSPILETFFPAETSPRIPIVTFNRVSMGDLQMLIDHLLLQYPNWVIGAVCRDGVLINRSEKVLSPTYNVNVSNLLRNPRLDLLIAEYRGETFEQDGVFYSGSDMVVLDNPTETEALLTRDVFPHSTVVVREGGNVSIRRQGLIEQYRLGGSEPFSRVYLKEIGTILA
ncbi:acetate--CoA ligase family protein [Leptolyngbya sp. CCNP1308]|uniref:acetate--CoA ligase family protein n=1 Tax=Leptolyngbya sp. CCNP1308 TaxID=3110255 RepID=UPI002B219807|nr:acetate--CoA ligase family protein [Leptolyngbya sp. CCNP1308]MEA5447833.1 acetate--CoA ligase family protein [Leptolyngbya sp. CCNP1308]